MPAASTARASSRRLDIGRVSTRCTLRWAAALIILTVITRLPSLLHPGPIDDEAVYATVAQEINQGGLPYVAAIERKPPLLFWTYALILRAAAGAPWLGLHAAAVLWVLLTMAGLYVLARRLFDPAAGLIAALLYCVFQPWATWKNLAFNGELLMNLPLVWAWALVLAPRPVPKPAWLLLSGALLAAAFLLKQPAAIAAVPLGAYLLLRLDEGRPELAVGRRVLRAVLLCTGFALVLGAVALVLARQGILAEAYYWTFTNHDMPHVFWTHGVLMTLAFIGACLPVVAGAVFSLRDAETWQPLRPERNALLALLAVSAFAAASPGRFYPHYYIQLLPPLAVIAAPAFAQLWRARDHAPSTRLAARVSWVWLGLSALVFTLAQARGLAPQRDGTAAGRYLQQHSAPTDRIFVWGQDPRIYLDAERRPASRYIMTFPLTGYIFGQPLPGVDTTDRVVPGAWRNLQQDFAAHPPSFIVDTQAGPAARYPVGKFPWLARELNTRYREMARTAEGVIHQRIVD